MCGRYAIFPPFAGLERRLGLGLDLPPRYNVAPGQTVPIVRAGGDGYALADAHWGLIPFWARERKIGYSTFNARVETVAEKPAFRAAFRHRRCLIPAGGFYEWQDLGAGRRKQPWFIADAGGDGLAFAGLWERWRDPDSGETVDSCSILVGPADPALLPIHARLACIVPPEHYRDWLAPDAPPPFLFALLAPYPAARLRTWRVSAAVGNVRNDGPELVAPRPEPH
ncbi:putative SOS response-associated peptidase YedK [Crenobacter luteus]|uniref:SOS response-associated peptidase n=1 Tax=Crenobacter luteus TaxID=1452487 RepID=UPI00104B8324|nr:SOS response-associated peptidase [Crenobacter luteus]TCP15738.1 putative SOS response-associated peptidase YedK [Crenobacter luteus]